MAQWGAVDFFSSLNPTGTDDFDEQKASLQKINTIKYFHRIEYK